MGNQLERSMLQQNLYLLVYFTTNVRGVHKEVCAFEFDDSIL